MAISARKTMGFRLAPVTTSGLVACAILVLSLLLLAARLTLTPAFGLPLNFLVVFATMAVSGVVALFAVALRHERGGATFVALVLGLGAAVFLAAETFGGGEPTATSLDAGDNGRTVTVQRGGQIVVRLAGNPSTGYAWETTVSDGAVLRESSKPAYASIGEGLGAGGTYTFRYEATAPGTADLTFTYRRSWESNVDPLQTYRITIVVQ